MIKISEAEQKEIALLNVTYYKKFSDYQSHYNISKDEFNEEIEKGSIQDITLGTFNGATNTFTNRKITNNHIIESIETEIKESNFVELFWENMEEFKNYLLSDWVREYTEFYKVFVIDNNIYVDLD
ncbi:hypothetical protein AABD41_01480 [Staphylococcus pseudoxylosus]|uniref:hypothetical protein n=1 Tax=Staphylococcus pseudoxylosus TaxID=2282419 RepID=UPI00398ABA2F